MRGLGDETAQQHTRRAPQERNLRFLFFRCDGISVSQRGQRVVERDLCSCSIRLHFDLTGGEHLAGLTDDYQRYVGARVTPARNSRAAATISVGGLFISVMIKSF